MSDPLYIPIYPRLPLEDMPQRTASRRFADLLLGRQSLRLSPFIDVEPKLKQKMAVSWPPVAMTQRPRM